MNESQMIDRLRITRELTKNEYKKLLKYEEEHEELKAEEIAQMFQFQSKK